MFALVLAIAIASHVHAPPQFRDPRVGMVGRPETAAGYARDARACGFEVAVRRLRDEDLVEKPNTFLPNTRIVLFKQPYDRGSTSAVLLESAEALIRQVEFPWPATTSAI